MEISRDGSKLLVTAGVPDNEISIWDLENKKKLNNCIKKFYKRFTGNGSTVKYKDDFIKA